VLVDVNELPLLPLLYSHSFPSHSLICVRSLMRARARRQAGLEREERAASSERFCMLCSSMKLNIAVGCSKIKFSVWERTEMKKVADHAHPK
jgi:hypothetical protein